MNGLTTRSLVWLLLWLRLLNAAGRKLSYKCSGDVRKLKLDVTNDCSRIQPFQIWQNISHPQWLMSLSYVDRRQRLACRWGLTKVLMVLFKGVGEALDITFILSSAETSFCCTTDKRWWQWHWQGIEKCHHSVHPLSVICCIKNKCILLNFIYSSHRLCNLFLEDRCNIVSVLWLLPFTTLQYVIWLV